MSNVKIEGNASGTGTLTIQAPNTSTDRTLNLPDKAGAIAVGAGTIVQVVQGTTSTEVVVTTTDYTDTTLSASITPSSSSNKILVQVLQEFVSLRGQDGVGVGIRLLRDSTTIWTPIENSTGPYLWYTDDQELDGYASINFLDSPSTTSNVTYKTQGRPYRTNNNGSATFQNANGVVVSPVSTIILMEVVA